MSGMNFCKILLVHTILFLSCDSNPVRITQLNNFEKGWKITNHTYSDNEYNSAGLLTTTLETIYVYREEILVDSIKSIVIRSYDKKKLVDKKDFTLKKDGSKILENETINNYDSNGNLILHADSMNGNNVSKTFYEYDSH